MNAIGVTKMTRFQAINSASYILGENIKNEFNKKEANAIAGDNSFFYVYNSEGASVRIDVVGGEYEVREDPS